jgi:LysM repeat protein
MAPVPAAAQPARVAALSVPTAAVGSVPARAVAPSAAKTYVVRAGDTLYSIARRFGTAVDTLLALNKLSANAVLHPGLRLHLP